MKSPFLKRWYCNFQQFSQGPFARTSKNPVLEQTAIWNRPVFSINQGEEIFTERWKLAKQIFRPFVHSPSTTALPLFPFSHARATFSSAASLKTLSCLQLRNYFQIRPKASFHTYPHCLFAGVMTDPSTHGVKMWLLLPCETAPTPLCPAVWEGSSSSPRYLHHPFGMWHCRWAGRQRREPLIFAKSALSLMHRGGEGSVSRALSLWLRQWAKQGDRSLGGTRYRAEQRGDKRDHGKERIMGEWTMQNSTCYSRGGFRKKKILCAW